MEPIQKYNAYRFGCSRHLTRDQLDQFIDLFNIAPKPVGGPLGGRTAVSFAEIKELGSVAVKHYFRGGILPYFNKNKYLKFGETRSQSEYAMLKKAAALGINVPEPLVYACRGTCFYQAWLVTRKIDRALTLARLSLSDKNRLPTLMDQVCRQIRILIDNGVLHVDLHPGNILVDGEDRVYIIDFDKSRLSFLKGKALRNRYINRWQRAVQKHRLSSILTDSLVTGLTQNLT